MADLATLQQKYEPVLQAIDRFTPDRAPFQNLANDGYKLDATLSGDAELRLGPNQES